MKAFIREVLAILVLAVAIFFLIQAVVQSSVVVYSSMEPNLHSGQRLVINKVVYKLHEPERGDIIVFHNPNNPNEDFIKRIIGWGKDLNQQGITGGNVTGMFGGTIPAWTSRKRAQQIDFCEEFQIIPWAHGTCLHEILA